MSNNRIKQVDQFADIFKALANPNRLKIFIRLATCCTPGTVGIFSDHDSACVGQLGQELDIVKSTVSHHIKELRRVGLIQTRRKGQKIECWVDPELLKAVKEFFAF